MSFVHRFSKLAAVAVAAFTLAAPAHAATVGTLDVTGEFSTGGNTAQAGGGYSLTLDQAVFSTLTTSTELLWEYDLSAQTNIPGFGNQSVVGSVQASAENILPALLTSLGASSLFDPAAAQALNAQLLANAGAILSLITSNSSTVLPVSTGFQTGALGIEFNDYASSGNTYSGTYGLLFTDRDPGANYDQFSGAYSASITVSTLMAPPNPTVVPLPASLPMLGAGLLGLWGVRRRKT